MFPVQRIEKLKKILLRDKTVTISALCEELEVSSVTVRKYLDTLDEQGFLRKFHGGAMLVEPEEPDAFPPGEADDEENMVFIDQIASIASGMVAPHDTIFLGSGLLCTALARKLSGYGEISVLTNNINAIPLLEDSVKNLLLIGGAVASQDKNYFTCGNSALSRLDGIYIQKAFYSVDGIDLQAGLTVDHGELCQSLLKINAIAKQTIILAESRRFDQVSMHHICDIHAGGTYVTDRELDAKYVSFFAENNIKLLTSCAL